MKARHLPAMLYMALCYGFIFLPVVVLLVFSFQAGDLPVPPLKGFSFRWYQAVFADPRLMSGFGNSLLVAAFSSALSTVLGFLAAYGLARYEVPGRRLIQGLIMLPMAVSYLLVGMGLLIAASDIGLPPGLPTVIIGHVVMNMPLAFAICLAQLGEHQRRIEYAARDLGAGMLRVLLEITAPLLAPALVAAFFLCFTLSWDEFLIAFLNTRFNVTLPVVIWGLLRGGLTPETNAAGALIFLISIGLMAAVEMLVLRKQRP